MIDECEKLELEKLRVLLKMFDIKGGIVTGSYPPNDPRDRWYELIIDSVDPEKRPDTYWFDHLLEMIIFVNDLATTIQRERAAS